MKCPKCSYVSFDYNLSCPKCAKDISAEQSKLNVPAFRPEVPFLLGGLTGHSDDNHAEAAAGGSSPASFGGETRQGTVGLPGLERGEITFEESEDLDLSADEGSAPQDTADFEIGGEAKSVELKESPIEDLALESDTLAIKQVDEDDIVKAAGEPSAAEEEAEEIDLDALDLDSKEEESGEGKEEIQLSLDDLKVGESGELEIGKEAGAGGEPLEIDELTLDEIPLGDELSLEKPGGKPAATKAEMGDEGETINLDDLGLDLDLEEEEKRP